MKKLFLCLTLCLCLLTAVSAAETLESWNQGSDSRIVGSADVWNLPEDAESGAAPLITLPKGTLVRINAQNDAWCFIDYYAGGAIRSGVVRVQQVAPVNGPDPTATPLPTATIEPLQTPEPTPVPTAEPILLLGAVTAAPTPTPTAVTTPVPAVTGLTVTAEVNGLTEQATLVTLGSYTSVVSVSGAEYTVDSSTIVCSDAVSRGQQIAMVTAPKSGKATLREEASTKSNSLCSISHGTLVAVLSVEDNMTKVFVNGQTGYILTSCLKYDVLVSKILGTGTLTTSKGSVTGKGTAPIRAKSAKNATKIAEWNVGTTVTVLSRDDDWYDIELNGVRGYVNKQFLKMN